MDSKLLLLPILLHFTAFLLPSGAINHVVGDNLWTIPPSSDFYANWSQNRTFAVGDNLVFRFETGFYNAVQVSRREYLDCTAENPFRSFIDGPATVRLNGEGMTYFITSFGNYCFLGQKLAVPVQRSAA